MNNIQNFDPQHYRYPSRRTVVYGSRGMVASAQPLAAQAGLTILKQGGNAVDAAIATAAALTVVEPVSNGLGSDAFALIWKDGKLTGINGSGYAPAAWSLEGHRSRGWKDEMPWLGWDAATVPGAIAMWRELAAKMGRLPLKTVLAPAIEYARGGVAVSANVAYNWAAAFKRFAPLHEPQFQGWKQVFAPRGRAPRAGEVFCSEAHARTLEAIGETNGEEFYRGEIARQIVTFARQTGGSITMSDLAEFAPEWVEPISVNYRGYDIWEIPPNGQGICTLMALSILKNFDFAERDSAAVFHRQIEAIKMGFADAHRFVADQRFAKVPVAELLADSYGACRAALISDHAQDFQAGTPMAGGTVYFSAADKEGTMVSFIQSNYKGFGSGVVEPQTGIAFNDRGNCFSLNPIHPNVIAGRKRPYNTIIPAFITHGGKPVGPFGVMGGFMQPQGQTQVVMNLVDFGMNPQEALDAPRWQWEGGLRVTVEPGFPAAETLKLAAMGHGMVPEVSSNSFGRGQIIMLSPEGTLVGATEPRADGCVAAW